MKFYSLTFIFFLLYISCSSNNSLQTSAEANNKTDTVSSTEKLTSSRLIKEEERVFVDSSINYIKNYDSTSVIPF